MVGRFSDTPQRRDTPAAARNLLVENLRLRRISACRPIVSSHLRRMVGRILLLFLLTAVGIRGAENSDDAPDWGTIDPPPTVKLVSDCAAVVPGSTFRVGLLIDLKPGRIMYSPEVTAFARAPDFQFIFPDGFIVEETTWPFPAPNTEPNPNAPAAVSRQSLLYRDELLVFAKVKSPASISDASITVNVRGDVPVEMYRMSLRRPFRALEKAVLVLPVGSREVPAHQELFEKYAARVPHAPPKGVQIRWRQEGGAVRLEVTGLPAGKYKRLDLMPAAGSAFTFEFKNASMPALEGSVNTSRPVTLRIDHHKAALMAVPADQHDLVEVWTLPESSLFPIAPQ